MALERKMAADDDRFRQDTLSVDDESAQPDVAIASEVAVGERRKHHAQ